MLDDDEMLSAKRSNPVPPSDLDFTDVRDSVRVLSEVIRHLAERVELLEARESLGRLRPAEG